MEGERPTTIADMIARQDRGERPVADDDGGDYTVPLSLFPARGVTVVEPAPAAQRSRVGEIVRGLAATIADETATEEAQVAQRQRLARNVAALLALRGLHGRGRVRYRRAVELPQPLPRRRPQRDHAGRPLRGGKLRALATAVRRFVSYGRTASS
jgi:hypothetical protein